MKISYFRVDAFTNKVFQGNPAAVCILDNWIDDSMMQQIAQEQNLSETAFCVLKDDMTELRWFTPDYEIDLCGHATLATAFVLFEYLNTPKKIIYFHTKSGILEVEKNHNLYKMKLPLRKAKPIKGIDHVIRAIGKTPLETFSSRDLMLVYESEKDIMNISPNVALLKQTNEFGVIITAKGDNVDFVSRYFAPTCRVFEDPVTGSSHCTLIPYWAEVLNKKTMTAMQLSKRTGTLYCQMDENFVTVSGEAVFFSKGEIII